MQAPITPLKFLQYHRRFKNGETPQGIQKKMEESAEQQTDFIFNTLNAKQSEVQTVVEGWVKEVALLNLPEGCEANLTLIAKRINELKKHKTHLNACLDQMRENLRTQQLLRKEAAEALEKYQLQLDLTPTSFAQEPALIRGGKLICANITKRTQ